MAEAPPGMLVVGLETGGGVVVEEPPPLPVLVRVDVLLLDLEVDVDEGTLDVVTWLPGRHCEYHWFWATQLEPEAQHVAPCQPLPPHWPLLFFATGQQKSLNTLRKKKTGRIAHQTEAQF